MLRRLVEKHGPLAVFAEFPVLIQLGLICTCAEMAWATLLLVMQFYFKEELLVSETPQQITAHVAQAMFAFVAAETLFKYPMGRLADKYGVRRFVLYALGLCVVTPLLAVFCREWWEFIPLRACDGLAAAALWPCMSSLMARSVPRNAKAAAMSVFNGAYLLGLAVGPLAGLTLGKLLHTDRLVFPVCSVVMAIGLVIAYLYVPHHVEPGVIAGEVALEEGGLLKGKPMLVRMMFLYALAQFGMGILGPDLPVYLQFQFGITQSNLALPMAIPALAIVLVAIPLGRVADYIGRARAIWLSYAMALAGVILIADSSQYPPIHKGASLLALPVVLFFAGALLMIFSYILGTPAWLGLTSLQVDDKKQAQVLSLMQTAQGFGVVVALAVVSCGAGLMALQAKMELHVRHFNNRLHHLHTVTPAPLVTAHLHDTVPISVWFWASCVVFALVLLGTLLYVREPDHIEEGRIVASH